MRTVAEKLKIVNDYLDQSRAPVPVIALAGKLGIRVYNAPWPDNISGRIQKDEQRGGSSGFAIFVNKAHPETRRRFTIAHEIAHYVLHEHAIGDGVFDDALYRSGLTNAIEVEANKLAADILMPWRLLNLQVQELGYDVDALAKKFKVSPQAMSIRLGIPT